MSMGNSSDEIFESKRDRWATVFVWGITLFMRLAALSITLMDGPAEELFLAASATIL